MSAAPVAGLEPQLVWQRFHELTQIPRPPRHEGPARDHVLRWARERGLGARADEAGNVVVSVPARPGREDREAVVLQSHLDMVCERDPASPYDPRQGRIHVLVEDDWVAAEGTTLGADNGIGVAVALALVDDDEIAHGPLELLFTVSEEQGLDGAKALDPSLVTGRLLVNLDGSSDDALTVGCAGSDHTFLRLPVPHEPVAPGDVVLRVEISGARGGHSGEDVAAGRVNAIKALGRVLSAGSGDAPLRLASLEGGVSRNAIPRDARAVVAVPADGVGVFRAAAQEEVAQVARQYARTDGKLVLAIDPGSTTAAADLDSSRTALDLLAAIPTGVLALAPGLTDVVETSTSLTVATTEDRTLTFSSMARSSNAAALDELLARTEALARLAGAELEVRRSYPPWEPQLDSELLRSARGAYARLFGGEPRLAVVHGGLECAVLGQRLPGIEMVSIGAEIVGPHAPGEKVSVSSTQRFYRLLGALLDDL